MEEILKDKDALSCFIEFMESRKSGQYIRFWLDAESFQASTWSRLRSHSLNSAKRSALPDKLHPPSPDPCVSTQQDGGDRQDTGSVSSNHTLTEESTHNATDSENQTRLKTDTGQVSAEPDTSDTYKLRTVIQPKPSSLPATPLDPGTNHLPGSSNHDCDNRDNIESRLSETALSSAIKRTESLKVTHTSQEELANKLKKSMLLATLSHVTSYNYVDFFVFRKFSQRMIE
jgi:hypothetical protein